MTQDLTGNWTGTITYGNGYVTQMGKELYFDLELAHYADSVVGIAKDTGGEGMSPDHAEIDGTFTQNKIKFFKQYISLHYYTKEGTHLDRSRRGPLISYTGTFDPTEETFKGEWSITVKGWSFGFIPKTVSCGGTWTMKRKVN